MLLYANYVKIYIYMVEFSPLSPIKRLGVDIGRVIMGGDTDTADLSVFDPNYLQVPEVEGAFDGLHALGATFPEGIDLVSKCGPRIQRRTIEWLQSRSFFSRTGIEEGSVHFCLDRSGKGAIAGRLGLTDFIDDRIDVLRGMPSTVSRRVLFKQGRCPDRTLICIGNWGEVVRYYTSTN